MAIEVRVPTIFRKFTDGQAVVAAAPGTLRELVHDLEGRYPGFQAQLLTDDGELHRFVNVYVNDEDARYLQQLDTPVADGDTVSLLPSVAGGARGRGAPLL
ncbi:MAG: MoaD/ThiS family protein [Actinomycetota bacterium]|nr:MoaD/ThiS family protein [Actinomycetota bacterium]